MANDGKYSSILDKDKILKLLDDIEQNIIWMFYCYLMRDNQILTRYLGYYPDAPMCMDALSGSNITHVKHSKGQHGDSTAVISLVFIKWNIDDVEI